MKTPGRYFITVSQVGRSLSFSVGDDVYKAAFEVQAYGVFAQRCGIALGPPQSEWRRIACHRKGLVLTSQNKNEQHDIKDLPRKVVRRPTGGQAAPALEWLTKDARLVAYYPLDGDFRDASGHGHDLTPLSPAARFSPSKEILPTSSRVLGPTQAGKTNGGTARGIARDQDGCTICGWLKKDENNDFHGIVFGLGSEGWDKPHAIVTAGWGVLSFSVGKASRPVQYARVNDNAWHHLALVVAPAAEKPRRASLYVDGRLGGSGEATASLGETFSLGTIAGSGAGNAYFADFRLYARAPGRGASDAGQPRPAESPVVLAAYGGHHDAGDYNPRCHSRCPGPDGRLRDGAGKILRRPAQHSRERKRHPRHPRRGALGPAALDGSPGRGRRGLRRDRVGRRPQLHPDRRVGPVRRLCLRQGRDGFLLVCRRHGPGLADMAGDREDGGRRRLPGPGPPRLSLGRRAPAPSESAAAVRLAVPGPKAYAAAQLLHTTGEARFNKDFLDVCVWSRKPDAEIDVYGQYDQSLAAWAHVTRRRDACQDPRGRTQGNPPAGRSPYPLLSNDGLRIHRNPWAPINWGTGATRTSCRPSCGPTSSPATRSIATGWCAPATTPWGPIRSAEATLSAWGTRTVHAPLHNSRYCHLGEVVAGQQVEGPVQKGDGYRVAETAYPPSRTDFANLQTFVDCHFAIDMDEGVVSSQVKTMAAFGLLLRDPPK